MMQDIKACSSFISTSTFKKKKKGGKVFSGKGSSQTDIHLRINADNKQRREIIRRAMD